MGIRFRCHHCESELHVKDFQAGKRGRCPDCKGKFRIPLSDAEHSFQVDEASAEVDQVAQATSSVSEKETVVTQTLAAESVSPPANTKLSSQAATSTTTEPAPSSPVAASVPKRPRALSDTPDAKWFVRPTSGGQYGPAASASMWQWLSENRIGSDSLVWCEGWPEWLVAGEVFVDFFPTSQVNIETGPAAPTSAGLPSPSNSNQADTPSSTRPALTDATPVSDRNRATRKQKRRRNYTVMIAILSVVMLGLIVALAFVLSNQQG